MKRVYLWSNVAKDDLHLNHAVAKAIVLTLASIRARLRKYVNVKLNIWAREDFTDITSQ